jgi:hypothetical protein
MTSISPRTAAAVARYAGTIALTVLIAIQPSYPNAHWLSPVILVLGYLGYHAVPTAVQVVQKLMPSVTPGPGTYSAGTIPVQPITFSNNQLTDEEVAEIGKRFKEYFPVQSPPAQAPVSQAGSPTDATETANKET